MTNRQRGGAAAAGGALLLAAGLAVAPGGRVPLGDVLVASGYTMAVSKAQDRVQVTGPVDVAAPLDWASYGAGGNAAAFDASFFARYQLHTGERYGLPYRGNYCRPIVPVDVQLLQAVARHSSDPLGLGDRQWEADRTDLEDLRYASLPGVADCSGLAWDRWIYPAACRLGLATESCPGEPPPPDPGPTPPPPTPTPEPPPPGPSPTYGWSVEQDDCQGSAAVCLSLKFFPSSASTGRLTVTVTDD